MVFLGSHRDGEKGALRAYFEGASYNMIIRSDMLRLHQTFTFGHTRTRSASDSHYRRTRSPQPAWLGCRPPTSRALGKSERASARMAVKRLPAWISVDKERR